MTGLLLSIALLPLTAEPVLQHTDLPTDPFQRTAYKALRGDFGALAPWQRYWYAEGLEQGWTVSGRAKVTSYGPWEPPAMSGGPYCWVPAAWFTPGAKGFCRVRLTEGCAAANPEIAKGAIVWTPYGLRLVTDRGGWVKLGHVPGVGRVTRASESANLDYFTLRPLSTLRGAPYLILRARWAPEHNPALERA